MARSPGPARTGGSGRYVRTEEQKAAARENLKKASEASVKARRGQHEKEDNRDRLRVAITKYGIADITEIIARGPWQLIEVETRDGVQIIPLNEERSRLWQYAMNYAADRGGLPRAEVVQLSGAEHLGPIEVRFSNFERPADT